MRPSLSFCDTGALSFRLNTNIAQTFQRRNELRKGLRAVTLSVEAPFRES